MLLTLALVSLVVFIATLITIPFILVRLPADYFDVRVKREWMKDSHPLLRFVAVTFKNIIGVLFLLAGIAMLVLPGQGVLTILIGISLMDFPGKQRLEARIVGQRTVLSVINSLRQKFGKSPLVIAPDQNV
jgi:putative transmembrane protein PGPGW